jgi:hypothetical protein
VQVVRPGAVFAGGYAAGAGLILLVVGPANIFTAIPYERKISASVRPLGTGRVFLR